MATVRFGHVSLLLANCTGFAMKFLRLLLCDFAFPALLIDPLIVGRSGIWRRPNARNPVIQTRLKAAAPWHGSLCSRRIHMQSWSIETSSPSCSSCYHAIWLRSG